MSPSEKDQRKAKREKILKEFEEKQLLEEEDVIFTAHKDRHSSAKEGSHTGSRRQTSGTRVAFDEESTSIFEAGGMTKQTPEMPESSKAPKPAKHSLN